MEVTLEEIIDSIDSDEPGVLKLLLAHYTQLNEYFEIEEGVLMTPLLYAIKMKSPDCVDMLIMHGADPSFSLKIQESTGERSLNTNALEYATGEKKKASGHDKENYEDIILILTAKLNGIEIDPPSPSSTDIGRQFAAGSEPTIISPSQTANAHRVAQSTLQNQIGIKKLSEENASLKKEIQQLRQDIERFRPWIERWIYESTPGSTTSNPILPSIIENDNVKPKKIKKTRASTRDGNGQVESPLRKSSGPKTISSKNSINPERTKSVVVRNRSIEPDKTEKIVKRKVEKKIEVEEKKEEIKSPKRIPKKKE